MFFGVISWFRVCSYDIGLFGGLGSIFVLGFYGGCWVGLLLGFVMWVLFGGLGCCLGVCSVITFDVSVCLRVLIDALCIDLVVLICGLCLNGWGVWKMLVLFVGNWSVGLNMFCLFAFRLIDLR